MLKKMLRAKLERLARKRYVKKHYVSLTNTNFSIFSQSCWGGVLTQDLGMAYTSPTCNMFFTAEDFVKFCERPIFYLSIDMIEEEKKDVSYPVGRLDDISLYFMHYHSFAEAKEKWNRRIGRIHYDNLFLVMTDRDGATEEILERFARLPYPKVYFSHLPHPEYDFVCYIPGFGEQSQIGDVTQIINLKGERLTDPYFDPIKFLNCE